MKLTSNKFGVGVVSRNVVSNLFCEVCECSHAASEVDASQVRRGSYCVTEGGSVSWYKVDHTCG